MGNYSFKTIGLPEPVNGVVEGHNFTQGTPNTVIYSGYSGLTFKNCNLLNCDVPLDSEVIQCQISNVSFCSNLNPDWLQNGYIPACVENCEHVTEYDIITIDGVSISTNYSYANKVVT